MSETGKTISQDEIQAVEREINKAKADELKKLSEIQAKEIEERVRKEFEERKRQEELAKEIEDLKSRNLEMAKLMDDKLRVEREAFEKRLQEIEGQKKGVSRNESPFQTNNNNNVQSEVKPNIRMIDGIAVDLNKLDYDRIQELSRQEWMRQSGITNPDWGKPRDKN